MQNLTYESQGTSTYLVYTIQSDDVIDSMSLGMITNNKITGLTPTMFMQMDTEKYIKYNVSSKISLSQFFSGMVNKKRLLGVFSSIVDGLLSAEDYMLDPATILLDLDYIYVDVSSCEATLICLPVQNTEIIPCDYKMFFKNIMINTQFDPVENADHVAKIFNHLNSVSTFLLADFKQLLDSLKENQVNQTLIQVQVQPQVSAAPQPKVQVQRPVESNSVHVTTNTYQSTSSENAVIPPKEEPYVAVSTILEPVREQPQLIAPKQTTEEKETGEKKISLLGLLRNYSKENKELYQQQKEAQKNKKNEEKVAKVSKPSKTPKAPFVVPGPPTGAQSFAIPGQPSPAIQPPLPKVQSVAQPQPKPIGQPTPIKSAVVQQQPITVSTQQPTVIQVPVTSAVQGQGLTMNFGETTVLNAKGFGETTVLNAAVQKPQAVMPYLVRTKTNEKISLNKPVFRIGKEKSYVDYFISDNTAISRSHANLITREGNYYVTDTNSTNHTFLNGKMLTSNVEVEVHDNDTIRLANEDFTFRLM